MNLNPFNALRKEKKPDEQALRKQRERGEAAQRLMKDELLAEAFAEVERVYLTAWRNSGALDIEMRERAHIAVNLLDDVKNHLFSVVRDGIAAANRLTLAEDRKRRAA